MGLTVGPGGGGELLLLHPFKMEINNTTELIFKKKFFNPNYFIRYVFIECGNAFAFAAFPFIHKLKGVLMFLSFITTTTIVPSGFLNAVVNNWLRVALAIILLAPG